MWLAVEDSGTSSELVIAIFTLAGVVVTALGAIFVALVNSRSKSSDSPPVPVPVVGETGLVERLAVTERRLDDGDERDEIQDRRIDQIERHLDLNNPFWMGRPR